MYHTLQGWFISQVYIPYCARQVYIPYSATNTYVIVLALRLHNDTNTKKVTNRVTLTPAMNPMDPDMTTAAVIVQESSGELVGHSSSAISGV